MIDIWFVLDFSLFWTSLCFGLAFLKVSNMAVRFDGRVAIVTGAGNGLGRSHAIELARRGAKVVVNDLGTQTDGEGASSQAALDVVQQIEAEGGEAIANNANVVNGDEVNAMVMAAMEKWGRLDILINNAGILRDKTFSNMSLDDFKVIMDVHLMGAVTCCKAVWEIMREQHYGRILMTSSQSGLYGNFGQTNYAAAKMALIGLMNVLALEGESRDIRVNALAPAAATRMLEGLADPEVFKLLNIEAVTAGALTLVYEDAPSRMILTAGAGGYASIKLYETEGIFLPDDEQTPESIVDQWESLCDESRLTNYPSGPAQTEKFLAKAIAYRDSIR